MKTNAPKSDLTPLARPSGSGGGTATPSTNKANILKVTRPLNVSNAPVKRGTR